ncbi:uncharacterized protein LOC125659335 isoform X2 [Ostrea edulis]|uniref:uncharacterized protein LOC125659335 isoform X2 n=1 Tax=Ostrea edulis TaxID=37623 RepID=UPI0024AFCDA4|nr:uncharacterized protein LOC125659335 isoform X2 [Ostrea edulis]
MEKSKAGMLHVSHRRATTNDMDYEMNFIYVNERSFSYNQAIDVCSSMNASLLTMRSWYKWFTIQQIYNSSAGWNALPNHEAWIGLTNTIYGFYWIDCEPLDFSRFTLFKDANEVGYKSNDQCYTTKEHDNFKWKQKKCSEGNGVICEQRIIGSSCSLSTILSLDFHQQSIVGESDCRTSCSSDADCFAVVAYFNGTNDQCIHMKRTSTGNQVTAAIKQCVQGEVKVANDVSISTENKDTIPLSFCSNSLAIHISASTAVSSMNTATLSASPTINPTASLFVDQPTSCFNITVIETETVMNNLTTYIPATTFSYIHSLLTTTVTTIAPTTVVMTTYLAPSTVTVEMTASLATCQDQTTFINITNTKYIQEAVENITKALYLDKKTTSSYVRSKTCAEDKRTSSATVGYFGIIFIVVPFGIMFLADLCSIYKHLMETVRHCCVSPDRKISTDNGRQN